MARRRAYQAAIQPQVQRARPVPIPAPVGGWNTRDSIAAMPQYDALVMDNWIVRPGKVSMRRGQQTWATGLSAVETLMPYSSGGSQRLFAATNEGIFDATAQGSVGAVSSAASSGRWQFTNFSNSVAQWLACVNGVDPYRYFDGSAWVSPATFTYNTGTVATSEFNNVCVYNQRLFFVRQTSLDLWFLGIGAISGAVFKFPLSQLCKLGGYLVACGTWTIDAGDGVDDLLVMVTSEGEVIIYRGTDPTVASSWTLQGVYTIGRPLGKRCLQKYGGDLLYLSERGLLPLSKVLQSVTVDKSPALSDKINTTFRDSATTLFSQFGWEICQHSNESFFLVNVPSSPPAQYVMDFQSKNWSRFLGYDAQCWAYFRGNIYYGGATGTVQAYVGASDFGANIVSDLRTAYNYFGNVEGQKKLGLVRPSFSASGRFSYSLNCSTDFDVFGGPSVTMFPDSNQSRWDSALWDQGVWTSDYYLQNRWGSVACWPFFAMSLGIKMSLKGVTPDLVKVDYTFEGGGIL